MNRYSIIKLLLFQSMIEILNNCLIIYTLILKNVYRVAIPKLHRLEHMLFTLCHMLVHGL